MNLNSRSLGELRKMPDEELLDELDMLRHKMSYYNAAEGQQWHKEKELRRNCSDSLNTCYSVVRERNLTPRKGNFLC